MSERRTRYDIYAAILHIARNGSKKSHIIYKANLSFNLGEKYFNVLIDKGLLNVSYYPRLYTSTTRGLDYVTQFNGLSEFVNIN